MYMTRITYHYGYGPSYTLRLNRSLFKKVYGPKLRKQFRKSIVGYSVAAGL
jgi:hypothetical protein